MLHPGLQPELPDCFQNIWNAQSGFPPGLLTSLSLHAHFLLPPGGKRQPGVNKSDCGNRKSGASTDWLILGGLLKHLTCTGSYLLPCLLA